MRRRGRKILFVLLCILFFWGTVNTLIQAQNVLPAASYCNTDPSTIFYISNPGDKTWTCSVGGVILNLDNGSARFSPSLVPGPYPRVITILYQNPNYIGEPADAYDPTKAFSTFSVTISTPPLVTFAAIADVCQTDASFNLTPQGNPAGGLNHRIGVIGNMFNRKSAGGQINTLIAAEYRYEEVDEIEKTRNIILSFSLVLPGHSFGLGKYQTLAKNQKTKIAKDDELVLKCQNFFIE